MGAPTTREKRVISPHRVAVYGPSKTANAPACTAFDTGRFARSILRWAGGKSHLLPHLVTLLPAHYSCYIEPMLGGGALFFHAAPREALLGDINEELINFYRVLRDDGNRLCTNLLRLKASKPLYYKLRMQSPRSQLGRAIRLAYLNRLSWNGLYRVNRGGAFNVPIGDRLPKRLWRSTDLFRAREALQVAQLIEGDFHLVLRRARKDDFVFLDPPYPRGAREALGFNRYSVERFGLEDHRRLAAWIERLSGIGVNVMLTIGAESDLREIYPRSLRTYTVMSRSLIAGNGAGRREVCELVLTNYET